MKILFLILVALFQAIGCLQPVQAMVQVAMSTGLVHNPQTVFIFLALAIIVFAALIKFVPGFAAKFQTWESAAFGFITGANRASGGDMAALAAQVTELTAMVNALQKASAPVAIVTTAVNASPEAMNSLATGQPAAAAPAGAGQ